MDHIPEQLMYDLVDGELSAEESERAIAHISACKRCREILAEIRAAEEGGRNLWRDNLSRVCPDADTLYDYFDGRLRGHSLEDVKKHIEECPMCRATVRIASASRERFTALERASKEFAPALMERIKRHLDKVEVKGFMDGLAEILAPSRLGGELFDFLSGSAHVLTYPFASPLDAPALMPMEAGGVKLADTGKGFQRRIVAEAGTPFEVELVQFGDRFIMNLKALDEGHREALVRYSLMEAGQMRRQGVLLVSEGKGTVQFSEEEIEALRPEKRPLNLKLEVLLKGDVISGVNAGDILSILERLEELLLSEDPDIPDSALEALRKIEGLITEKR